MDNSVMHFLIAFILSTFLQIFFSLILVIQDFKNKEVSAKLLYLTFGISLMTQISVIINIQTFQTIIYSLGLFIFFLIVEKSVHIVNLFSNKYKGTDGFLGDGDKWFIFSTMSIISFVTMLFGAFFGTNVTGVILHMIPIYIVLVSLLSIIQFYVLEKNKKERKVSLFPSLFIGSFIIIFLNQYLVINGFF